MDPLLEVQRKSRGMNRDAYREALDRPVKAVTESTPYRLADLILNGEDVDLPMAESLTPTVPLQAKLKQGKLPGLADILDVPNPLKAMGPIAFTLKELRNGARMGKTLRNIEKVKDARKYVTAYHKTMNENVPSIDKEGLKLQHPDYGANTSDTDAYSPMIWLSGHPTFIPVLRRYGEGLDETTTYKVKIPRKEFYETPRMMMPQGRGGPKVMAAKGEPSWSKEAGKYVINTYGKDIPPEYLEKMDNTDRLASILKTERQNDLRDVVASLVESGEIPSDIPMKYGVPPSEKFIRYGMQGRGMRPASNSQLGNIVQDEMRTNFPPPIERLGYGLEDATAAASEHLKTLSAPRYPMSPFRMLSDAMQRPFIAKIPPFKSRLELQINPPVADPKPSFKPGAVSRGLDNMSSISPKDRIFNWTSYNDSREFGKTPFEATAEALPWIVYKNGDPTERLFGDDLRLAKGAISRDTNRLPTLKLARQGFFPILYLENFSQPDKSRALEKIFSSPSLSDLREQLGDVTFRTPPGSILRGDGRFHANTRPRKLSDLIEDAPSDSRSVGSSDVIPIEELYKKFENEYDSAQDNFNILELGTDAKGYAKSKVRQIMRERANPQLRR